MQSMNHNHHQLCLHVPLLSVQLPVVEHRQRAGSTAEQCLNVRDEWLAARLRRAPDILAAIRAIELVHVRDRFCTVPRCPLHDLAAGSPKVSGGGLERSGGWADAR